MTPTKLAGTEPSITPDPDYPALIREHSIGVDNVYQRLKAGRAEESARREGQLDLGPPPAGSARGSSGAAG